MRYSVFLILIALVSCQQISEKTIDEEQLLQEELSKINWKEVDEFPTVLTCETKGTKEEKKACFFNYLTSAISVQINSDSLQNLYPQLDSLRIKITVFPNSKVTFETQNANTPELNSAKLDSILTAKSENLEKIEPAIKRGIKVKTQFEIPIYFKNE